MAPIPPEDRTFVRISWVRVTQPRVKVTPAHLIDPSRPSQWALCGVLVPSEVRRWVARAEQPADNEPSRLRSAGDVAAERDCGRCARISHGPTVTVEEWHARAGVGS